MSTHLSHSVKGALKDTRRQSWPQLLAAAAQQPLVQRAVEQLQQYKAVARSCRPGNLSLTTAVARAALGPLIGMA